MKLLDRLVPTIETHMRTNPKLSNSLCKYLTARTPIIMAMIMLRKLENVLTCPRTSIDTLRVLLMSISRRLSAISGGPPVAMENPSAGNKSGCLFSCSVFSFILEYCK